MLFPNNDLLIDYFEIYGQDNETYLQDVSLEHFLIYISSCPVKKEICSNFFRSYGHP